MKTKIQQRQDRSYKNDLGLKRKTNKGQRIQSIKLISNGGNREPPRTDTHENTE
uniref:Uncharacterized protein n=1 Tax=Anguilla anguilla TaxID=7936 RepID=A0A0E9W376_ANGAN